ncbi:LacI family DNA-binding transcriptional regulator [Paenibacillus sp. GCM10027626]|uniref:LacI family DNA-binding transcriptional regulator n=1 Tax=Paenibacillus sp. GCM10027626 TaxID=3273411 RepID=UPI003630FDFF
MRKKRTVTIQELAEQLGLSRNTVSKALHGQPGMSLETREAVLKLAEEKGYRTREQKENALLDGTGLLHKGMRRFLFIVASDRGFLEETHQFVLQGIHDCFDPLQYRIDVVFIPEHNRPELFWEDWLEEHALLHADGIFISHMMPEELEAKLLQISVPKILINFPPTGAKVDSVIWDVQDAVRQAVRYLLNQGHRNILYVGDAPHHLGYRGYRLRWIAFQEEMAQVGIAVDSSQHVTNSMMDRERWLQSWKKCITMQKPTAILNTIDYELGWIYYACREFGIRIPQDCSLVSILYEENSFIPDVSHPLLPVRATGHRAAERMIWRIANPNHIYEHIRLQIQFIEGKTVHPIINSRKEGSVNT